MKRLIIATVVFAFAASLFSGLRNATGRAIQTTNTRRGQWRAQTQRIERMRVEREDLRVQMRNARRQAAADAASIATDDLAGEFATNRLKNMAPGQSERLLAELGFNWNSPGDYVFVSKKSLPEISTSAIGDDAKLTEAVCVALAITPGERAAIEAEAQRIQSGYTSWLKTHVKREEPSGDVLAKYVLTPDPQFSEACSNAFTTVVSSTLGAERSELFYQYVWNWMGSVGLFNAAPAYTSTSMTIRRSGKYLMMDLQQARSSMTCGLTPYQPLPEAFRTLFPGGWKDLAKREGFELPENLREKEMNSQK